MPTSPRPETERYSRQTRLPEVGPDGQARLGRSSALVLGCGALGSMAASALARAGVGRLVLVDRDVVELNNLHRQILYDEDDVAAFRPKAEAAASRLRRVNSSIVLEARVADVIPRNVEDLVRDVDLVIDGTDNFETRYLVNDACIALGRPWVYGGVVGVSGMVMVVRPGKGPCLRCIFPEPPPPGSLPTCESRGVLGTAPMIVASIQATEGIKLLLGLEPPDELLTLNLWDRSWQRIQVARDGGCRACIRRELGFLAARATAWVTSLCGQDAVQITPPAQARLDLAALSAILAPLGEVSSSGQMLRFLVEGLELLIFQDGRAIVRGTTDEAVARDLVARYLGG